MIATTWQIERERDKHIPCCLKGRLMVARVFSCLCFVSRNRQEQAGARRKAIERKKERKVRAIST